MSKITDYFDIARSGSTLKRSSDPTKKLTMSSTENRNIQNNNKIVT